MNSKNKSGLLKRLHQQGFTLLEVLVVLILVSLLSTFLLRGVGFMAKAHIAISEQLSDLQKGKLQEAWFRDSVAATVVQFEEKKSSLLLAKEETFKGNNKAFSGYTLASLDNQPGIFNRYGWQLRVDDNKTFLEYQTSSDKAIAIAWWHTDFGQFKYLDSEHKWHNQWPPAIPKDHAQLPQGIALIYKRKDETMSWFQEIQTQKTPPPAKNDSSSLY